VLHGDDRSFTAVAANDAAGAGDLAFALGAAGGAGVLLAREPIAGRTVVVVGDPKLAFAKALERLVPEGESFRSSVHPEARVAPRAIVSPGVVIGRDCEVGNDTVLFPNVVLYPGTSIGERCRIHAGTVIGADGFGYRATADGVAKCPTSARADRGRRRDRADDRSRGSGETVIGQVEVDDHVHSTTPHRRGVIIAAQTGLGRSSSATERSSADRSASSSTSPSVRRASAHRALDGKTWLEARAPAETRAWQRCVTAGWKKR
jgi:hypothetical protein